MFGPWWSIGVLYWRVKINTALGALHDVLAAAVGRIRLHLIGQHLALIELVEQRSSDVGDFSSMITAEVASDERTATASGTLFGNMPRLVKKGDFVKEGQPIATVGEFGSLKEETPYFEIRKKTVPEDPLQWLKRR